MTGHRRVTEWVPAEGLAFTCTRCGRCCHGPGDVWVTLVEAVAIAEQLCGPGTHPDTLVPTVWRYEAGWYRIGVAAGSACPLLTPDGCSVQGSKPNQCQTYPFWPEYLGSPEAWNAEEARCEGIGRGPNRYAAADIMRLLARRAVTREND